MDKPRHCLIRLPHNTYDGVHTMDSRPSRLTLDLDEIARSCYSAVISDCCDRIGLRTQTAAPGLSPASFTSGVVVGFARTAHSIPDATETERPYGLEIDFIDSLRPGDLVVATVAGDTSAFWGELFSAAAVGRGARGAVIDGLVRDVDKIRSLGFPILARGTRPTDCNGRIRISKTDVPISCGGVIVRSGDLVVADADGIVFVPQDHISEVVTLAMEKVRTERSALQLLLKGATLAEVWERHRVL
jgi:4-hydroxy-4-methyl-2-oxoglutarate aldolase